MAYGNVYVDGVQSSTAGTPPAFYDGNSAQIGTLCRAWVQWTGGASPVIQASFNVSSLTRNATGDVTVNFSTAFADAKYSASVSCTNSGTGSPNTIGMYYPTTPFTTSAARFWFGYSNSATAQDPTIACVSVFR